MQIKINKKTYDVVEYTTFKELFKSLRFVFEPLDFIIKLPNKKIANTYFFVQRVDLCCTDKKNRIIKVYEDVKTERLFFCLSATNLFILPLGCIKEYRINDILK